MADKKTMNLVEGLEALREFEKTQPALRESYGLDNAFFETYYAVACFYFDRTEYANAMQVFIDLNYLDPQDARYPLGAALCAHHLEIYAAEVMFATSAAILDKENPSLAIYAADLLSKVGRHAAAIEMYNRVLAAKGEDPQKEIFRQRANLALQRLKNIADKPANQL